MQTAKVKAIMFDVYGTLLNPLSIEKQVKQFVPDGVQFISLWRAKQLEYSWLLSLMERYESFWQLTERALNYTCQRLEVNLNPTQHQQLMDCWANVPPFADVLENLEKLRARNIKLGALSNGNTEMLKAGLGNANIEDILDIVLSVDAVKVFKPSRRVYNLAMQNFKLEDPSELGFVSSNSWDAIGAAAFGFQVCWLNRFSNTFDDLGITPQNTVSEFSQLLEIYEGF